MANVSAVSVQVAYYVDIQGIWLELSSVGF